jgi:hypothetical protein
MILDFSFGGRSEDLSEISLNLVSGAEFSAFYTFFEPDPFKGVLGPSLAGKRPETETQILILVS